MKNGNRKMKKITVADNFFVSTKNELKRVKRSIQE